ncbi:TetR/AcrR family transcriptional regulator [Bradyrhizobium lablabi]|uniref:TetR/AcrR family transcriptional regulator n=1 Tax=Bradyrhizobium lablabi TaxID=722472 RepID=UPI001BAC8CBC|nr:TetR/AcrR family transcriptional regulator [Bradyrhizobium lablabi]MBR1122760.1 TetR/AcrR family transcriptional regulator [Bradyrhizobium lablabi]
MVQKRNPPTGRSRPKQMPPSAAIAEPKRRGRPRAYEPEVALARALDVFWKEGFAATSLDDLSAATGMNRPSLYGAFGDKRELYIKSYESYRNRARQRMGEAFAADLPLREMLEKIYAIALDMYLSGKDGPRGCFTVMTAASEAVFDPAIREMASTGLVETDRFFARIFKRGQERGELAASANPQTLALLASATLHTIAVRARVQVSRAELDAIVASALDMMCGPKK